MLQSSERMPTPYSVEAADHADRLRRLRLDIHLVELAVEFACQKDDAVRETIVMTLRRLQGRRFGIQDWRFWSLGPPASADAHEPRLWISVPGLSF